MLLFRSLWHAAFFALALVATLFGSAADARGPGHRRMHPNFPPMPGRIKIAQSDSALPVKSRNGTELPPYDTIHYFDQLIDHNEPSLGTFKQRFWFTYEFYEPGGPIILYTPGESNAADFTGFLTNKTINGQIAQQECGAVIVVEHRYYGFSSPFGDLSTASLKFHTIQQAIDDLVYFAQNVALPMPNGDEVGPDGAPWILTGGSYGGALISWTMVNKPDVFFAGYSSSGLVQSIVDFWQYFEPIRQNMPQNCSADVQAVVAHVDEVFTKGSEAEQQALKDNWGLGALSHLDDVAGALRYNVWDWQKLATSDGPGAQFFNFCDALEVKDGISAGKQGWGLEHALTAWGRYWNDTYYAIVCKDEEPEPCLGNYNATDEAATNITIDYNYRPYFWILCNEVGFSVDGAPEGWPTLVTRLTPPLYIQRQCTYFFPEAFTEPPVARVDETNKAYGGWDLTADRLFVANGKRDPWRDATMSSEFHFRQSTERQPIWISDGFHCTDLYTEQGEADQTVKRVQQAALAKMKEWLEEWEPKTEAGSSKSKVDVTSRAGDDKKRTDATLGLSQ